MALGFHKLNNSAARSSRKISVDVGGSTIMVTPTGSKIYHSVHKSGVTMSEFVSDCDQVVCRFGNTTITVIAREIR